MNIGIILAGGSGQRMGANLPKQFIEVLNKPIIAYTLEIYQNHPEIDAIEIVCIHSHIDLLKEIVKKYNYSKVKWICEGGEDFQHSVLNGVNYLRDKINDDDIVLIHYGVAPYTPEYIITDSIRVSKEKGNSVSATPCLLLLGTNDGDRSEKWIDRDKIMQLNGPQGFRFGYVKQLYALAVEKGYLDKVEPHTTSLMFYMGEQIYFAAGSQVNLKITTKEDLELFEGYILFKLKNQ